MGELTSQFAASIAINCLSKLCNEELATVLYMETLPLFNCSKAFLRKKTCILSYKLVLHSSDSIDKLVPYLADRLQDPSMSVKISAVTAIQKITSINPRLFLITIPTLFELMVGTKSNWLLIKLIKLLTEMCKAEERLLPKLTAKFREMLQAPRAKSVEFELLKAVFSTRLADDHGLFLLARKTLLAQFLKSKDPNLAFLGLEAFHLMLSSLL